MTQTTIKDGLDQLPQQFIRELREKKGMSQLQLAELLNVTKITIQEFELSGKINNRMSLILNLLYYLDFDFAGFAAHRSKDNNVFLSFLSQTKKRNSPIDEDQIVKNSEKYHNETSLDSESTVDSILFSMNFYNKRIEENQRAIEISKAETKAMLNHLQEIIKDVG